MTTALNTPQYSQALTACRACGAGRPIPFLNLGRTPLADRLLTQDEIDQPEILIDLEVAFCPHCALVQITETVDPEVLFCSDYPYYSSVSPHLLAHFRASAEQLIALQELNDKSLVIEAASNDGYMLKNFAKLGIPVLGIDPAEGPVRVARASGIPTLQTFFTTNLARRLHAEGKMADLFLANNVLAHVPDLNGFVSGIRLVLKDDGVAVIEAPYVIDLIKNREFDTIYHQHLCYFSVTALDRLFRANGLFLNHVGQTDIHGGSLRLFVGKEESVRDSVRSLLFEEEKLGAAEIGYYLHFGEQVGEVRDGLLRLLRDLRLHGKRIVGYGAAAKACTLLNYCGIGTETLDYIADNNPHKHAKYMGGNHVPIVSPDLLNEDDPDYVLILAWNFADEIIRQSESFTARGGKFIIPIPEVRVVP